MFADSFCAIHTHKPEFANFSLRMKAALEGLKGIRVSACVLKAQS